MIRFGSLFSGIEAASVAWEPFGWRCAWTAEIDPFASAVLRHRYPDVPNLGDVNEIEPGAIEPVDLVVFGSPCQSFSVAGKRLGLDDPRGNMALVGLRVVGAIRPRWVVWENVPGVLSSDGGRDFGAFLGLLGELGYGFAYRVLDAQHFGVPQRRRRVFVVGYLGDWRPPAAVLFEPESLRGNPAPRREAGQGVARPVASCAPGGSGYRHDADTADSLIAHAVRGKHNLSHREDTDTLIAFSAKDHGADHSDTAPTLRAGTHDKSHANAGVMPAVAFQANAGRDFTADEDRSPPLRSEGIGGTSGVAIAHSLRADGFDASEDGTGRGTPLVVTIGTALNSTYKSTYGDAHQARPIALLRALRDAVDEGTLAGWCLGILAAFWPQEVLRSEVHGGGIRCAAQPKRGLVNVALSRSQAGARWSVLDLWQAGCDGCPPQGWQPSEQLAGELGAYLSRLPYSPSPATRLMHDMWQASEGSGVLRHALSAVQEARERTCREGQPVRAAAVGGPTEPDKDLCRAGMRGEVSRERLLREARATGAPRHAGLSVRRLLAEECEALQGLPRSYTLVPYRGKPAADGPRYRAIGNSMAVPVVRWIGERIQAFEDATAMSEAAE